MIQIQINLYQRIILNKSIFVRTIERLPCINNPIPHQSIKIVYKNIAVRAAYMYNKLYIKVIQAAMLCNNRAVTLPILCRPEISAICFWL